MMYIYISYINIYHIYKIFTHFHNFGLKALCSNVVAPSLDSDIFGRSDATTAHWLK